MSPVTQVSTTTGAWSAWTRGGAELIFQEIPGRIVAVSMTARDGRMLIGKPEPLFEFPPPVLEGINWSVTADGESFLTVNSFNAKAPRYCNIVLGWTELVQGR